MLITPTFRLPWHPNSQFTDNSHKYSHKDTRVYLQWGGNRSRRWRIMTLCKNWSSSKSKRMTSSRPSSCRSPNCPKATKSSPRSETWRRSRPILLRKRKSTIKTSSGRKENRRNSKGKMKGKSYRRFKGSIWSGNSNKIWLWRWSTRGGFSRKRKEGGYKRISRGDKRKGGLLKGGSMKNTYRRKGSGKGWSSRGWTSTPTRGATTPLPTRTRATCPTTPDPSSTNLHLTITLNHTITHRTPTTLPLRAYLKTSIMAT